MLLLAVLAGHAELAAVDGDVDLRHGVPAVSVAARSALVRREHGADGVDRGIEPLGDLAIGRLQRPARAAVAASSSAASRERSAPSACSWASSVASPRSASRRRSTAASSASSASARRLLAASMALASVILGNTPWLADSPQIRQP